jgi:hypothetical protein
MIHAYDDAVHAMKGLKAARAYVEAAPAVPHALHMPSHIFTRLGYRQESAATNEKAWRVSESDVNSAGEFGGYRDFHSLNYLQYAYIQLGGYEDAKRLTGVFAAQYQALPNKTTHPDSPELEVRHLRPDDLCAPRSRGLRLLRYPGALCHGIGRLAACFRSAISPAVAGFRRDEVSD